MVIIMSWEWEKTSISTVDMLEMVIADTEVKKRSNSLGMNFEALVLVLFLGSENALKAKYPMKEMTIK